MHDINNLRGNLFIDFYECNSNVVIDSLMNTFISRYKCNYIMNSLLVSLKFCGNSIWSRVVTTHKASVIKIAQDEIVCGCFTFRSEFMENYSLHTYKIHESVS